MELGIAFMPSFRTSSPSPGMRSRPALQFAASLEEWSREMRRLQSPPEPERTSAFSGGGQLRALLSFMYPDGSSIHVEQA